MNDPSLGALPAVHPPASASFAEHYLTSDYAAFEQEHRQGGTFGLTMMNVVQGAGEYVDPPLPEFIFISSTRPSAPFEMDHGDGLREHPAYPPTVHLQPPNQECWFCIPDLHLRIATVPDRKLIELLDQEGLPSSAIDAFVAAFWSTPSVACLIDRMWHAAASPSAATNLVLDGAFLQLVGVLLAACGDERGLAPIAAIGDARLARAIDYIETHLPEPLTVGEIASVAAMSPSHFARSFSSATGEAVWAYVMRRRTERAREMLAHTNLSQAIVAHRCGFSDAGHLRRALRRNAVRGRSLR